MPRGTGITALRAVRGQPGMEIKAVTTIRANCPSCGDVQLRANDLTVRVCSDDESGAYTFRCPDCDMPVAKEASRRIVDLLVGSGVRMQVWRLPAELREHRPGPSFEPDDLLDFHLLLQTDTWFESLAAQVAPALDTETS